MLIGLVSFSEMPGFLLGLAFLLLFSAYLGWFPLAGATSSFAGMESLFYWGLDVLHHSFLPIITLALARVSGSYLLMRNTLMMILSKEYMRTARSKGLAEKRIRYRHALRNALLPLVNRVAMQMGGIVGGAVLVEKVFAYPGLGSLMGDAALARDYTLLQGILLVMAVGVLLANYFADLLCYDPRCNQSEDSCTESLPQLQLNSRGRELACHRGGLVNLLVANEVHHDYTLPAKRTVRAVNGINVEIREGEVVALVGESGSGKSTLAQALAGTLQPSGGEVYFRDNLIEETKPTRQEDGIQIVFQDPFSATSHRLRVVEAVREPLDINHLGTTQQRNQKVTETLEKVQLSRAGSFLQKYCYQLSGGQRQRVSLARALVMQPKLLIADEITSMLDPSTRANLLRLLKGLQNQHGFSMLYITHDISLAKKVADRFLIMLEGKIIEEGTPGQVLENPEHWYTRQLLYKKVTINKDNRSQAALVMAKDPGSRKNKVHNPTMEQKNISLSTANLFST